MRRVLFATALTVGVVATPAAADFSIFNLKNSLVQFALEQISVEGEFEITAEQVTEPRDGVTELEGVSIADADGVWFRAEAFSVEWNASSILDGQLDLEELTLRGAEVLRSPTPPEVEVKPDSELAAAEPTGLFDWPRSPIALRIGALRVERATIAAGVIADQALAFDAEGAALDQGDMQSLTLAVIRSDAIEGSIRLDYARDFAADTVRLDLGAEEAAGGLVAEMLGLPEESASRVSLQANGPIADWRLALAAEAERVLTIELDAAIDTRAPLAIIADGVIRPGPELSPDVAAALGNEARLELSVAENEAGVILIDRGALSSPALRAALSGQYQRSDGAIAGVASIEAGSALARTLSGLDFGSLGFNGRVEGVDGVFQAEGALRARGLTSEALDIRDARLDAVVERKTDGSITLNADGQADGLRIDQLTPETIGSALLSVDASSDGSLVLLNALSLDTQILEIAAGGSVNLDEETLSLDYRAEAPRLAEIAAAYGQDLTGTAVATGSAGGALAEPALDGTLTLDGLALDGRPLGQASLTHAVALGEQPSGTFTLDGALDGVGTVEGGLAFLDDGDVLRLSDITLTGLGARVAGSAALQKSSSLIDGALALSAPDLAPVGRVIGTPLGGAVEGEARLSSSAGRQAAAVSLTARRFSTDGLSAAQATLSASVPDIAAEQPSVSATLDARSLAAGDATIATTSASVDGPLSALAFRAEAEGEAADRDLTLSLGGVADVAAADPRVILETLDAALGEAAVALTRPLTIQTGADGTRFEDLALSLPGGGLEGSGLVAENGLQIAAALDLPTLNRFAAALAAPNDSPLRSGSARARVTLDTRAASAGGQIELEATDLRLADLDLQEGALDARLNGAWDGARAQATARISGPFGDPFDANVSLPLRPNGMMPAIPEGGALAGDVRWKGRIERLWELLPFPDHILSGALDLALQFSGDAQAPDIAGRVALEDGAYQFLETGTILTNLGAQSRIESDGAFRLELRAEDGAGAPVEADIAYDAAEIDATLKTQGAVLVRRDDATAALSLDIAAAGPVATPLVSGDIRIDRAEIRLLDATPPSVADLGPVAIKGEAPPEDPLEAAARADKGPRLDLRIHAPDSIFVRGRGLDSEWRADLDLTGSAGAPRLAGSVEKLRGRLDFLGQPFDLARGRMSFLGGNPPDPGLDIALERRRDSLLGRIAVRGSASAPEIAFESEPELPEDEVLPRILFGKSLQSLSPDQALSLASGLATLLSGDEGVIGKVRGAVGLDVLGVDSDSNGYAVRAGRNVADGVYVGVRQPVDGSGTSVEVEAEIFEGVTVDSEARQQGGSSVGLNYRFDF